MRKGLLCLLLISVAFAPLVMAQAQQYTSFQPGETWEDMDRVYINAHGGVVLCQDGAYYWNGSTSL